MPAYGTANQHQPNPKQGQQQFKQPQNPFQRPTHSDKSNIIEDVEYEEVE
jgi:hypothetical protein